MTCLRAILITWLIGTLPASAFAFASVEAGLTENPSTTPKATQGNVVVSPFVAHGRAMIRKDGSFAFLGHYPPATVPPTAPRLWAAKGSADLITWAAADTRACVIAREKLSLDGMVSQAQSASRSSSTARATHRCCSRRRTSNGTAASSSSCRSLVHGAGK